MYALRRHLQLNQTTADGKIDALRVKVNRESIVYDSFRQLATLERAQMMKKTQVQFVGEARRDSAELWHWPTQNKKRCVARLHGPESHFARGEQRSALHFMSCKVGIDSGGILKEWYLELSSQLFDPQYCLFVKSESGLYDIDPRSGVNGSHLEYFHFFGRLLAKAIFDRQMVDLPLCKVLYKHILGIKPRLSDLKDIDQTYHRSLTWMKDNDITGVIMETFTVMRDEFGVMREIELCEGGKDREVTEENKGAYIQKMIEWHTGAGTKEQLEKFLAGFWDIIPMKKIQVFTPTELESLMCGKQRINVDEMRVCTQYTGGYEDSSPPVELFWTVFAKLDDAERREVIRYTTGSSRVPLDGFEPCFTITKGESMDGHALPTAHTCFNQLVLPPFDAEGILSEKLKFAIAHGEGFHMS